MPNSSVSGWRRFLPGPSLISMRERIYAVVGALLGLVCCEWISQQMLIGLNPWFIGPMGASAVLLFAAPTTPMAQPWPMLGGNLVSGAIGVLCAKILGINGLTAAVAAGVAIAVMFPLRCLHPPGGAIAVTAVMGGTDINALGWEFVSGPVLTNSLAMLVVALLFNNMLQRRYPHRPVDQSNQHRTSDPLPSKRLGISQSDLDAVLAARGEVLDISKSDLEAILIAAEHRAYQRRFGDVCCEDIMSRDVVKISIDAPAQEAWSKLARHKIKAIPVVTDNDVLVGIVSLHDFFIGHDNQPLAGAPVYQDPDLSVTQLMIEDVIVARPQQPIVELVKKFSDVGLHSVPVVDEQRRVVGMLTQSDLVAALFAVSLRPGA